MFRDPLLNVAFLCLVKSVGTLTNGALFRQTVAQSMAANVDDISRSRGFKKIISGLRETEKNLVNHGSDGVK